MVIDRMNDFMDENHSIEKLHVAKEDLLLFKHDIRKDIFQSIGTTLDMIL